MKKFSETVKSEENSTIVHINDIAHLIHVSIHYAFLIFEMKEIREIIIKFGALFKNANVLQNNFYELLSSNGRTFKKVKAVTDHRWFSYYESILDIIELWPYLCEFLK